MITVACCWVRANVPYGLEYVTNLRAMVSKHLQRKHRFVALTDHPEWIPRGIEPIAITHDRKIFGWWAKAELFKRDLGDRVLYLDLDTVVVNALDPIVDFPADFALLPDAGTFKPKTSHRVVKRFNSSVMVWNKGIPPVIEDVPSWAATYWGDQDALGLLAPWAQTMPAEWFPRLSSLKGEKPGPEAKVVLCKVPKNNIAADLYPWVGEAWRAA